MSIRSHREALCGAPSAFRWYRAMLSWEPGLQSDQAASVRALPYRRLSLQLGTSSWISGLQTFGRQTSCYLQTKLYAKHLLNKRKPCCLAEATETFDLVKAPSLPSPSPLPQSLHSTS